jgi:hypothetical protein
MSEMGRDLSVTKSLFTLIVLGLTFWCSQVNSAEIRVIIARVDLQKGFKHDSVKIYVDGKFKYQKEDVTTNPVLDLAGGTDIKIESGENHIVKLIVNGKPAVEFKIGLSKCVYFGVSRDSRGHFFIERSDHPFFYD